MCSGRVEGRACGGGGRLLRHLEHPAEPRPVRIRRCAPSCCLQRTLTMEPCACASHDQALPGGHPDGASIPQSLQCSHDVAIRNMCCCLRWQHAFSCAHMHLSDPVRFEAGSTQAHAVMCRNLIAGQGWGANVQDKRQDSRPGAAPCMHSMRSLLSRRAKVPRSVCAQCSKVEYGVAPRTQPSACRVGGSTQGRHGGGNMAESLRFE